MNENVKIKIDEKDNTSPAGRGFTSSDVAFVIGFCLDEFVDPDDASKKIPTVKNIPTLCNSIEDFEKYFGKLPYILTEDDVKEYSNYGIKAGYDRGYVFAKELLKAGMSVIFTNLYVKDATSRLDALYSGNDVLLEQLKLLEDKNEYSVKYITLGGYPTVVPYSEDLQRSASDVGASILIKTAATRGDAVALIDYPLDVDSKLFDLKDSTSVYSKVASVLSGDDNGSYGTMMYPWGCYNISKIDNTVETMDMPASFGYLRCVARATKSGPNWLAIAGVNRGVIPGLKKLYTRTGGIVTVSDAEDMQPKFGADKHRTCINCITNIRPYGLTLWGNRTLLDVKTEGLVAMNFLNIRNMVSDIKKIIYTSAKSIMFEQNTETTWIKFKGMITPLLDQLQTGHGISEYKILKRTTRLDGTKLGRGELAAVIRIYPVDTIEYFELMIEINDKDVSVE